MSDGGGYTGKAESPISPGLPVVTAFERGPSVASLAAPGAAELQRITLHSSGGAAEISGLAFDGVGDAPSAVSATSIVVARAGAASETVGFTSARAGDALTLSFNSPLSMGNDELANLTISGDAGAGASLPNTTGISLRSVARADAGDARVTQLAPATISIGQWDDVRIDGAFADWEAVPRTADAEGDVFTTVGGGLVANMNVDLISSALLDSGDFLVQVSGTILGGLDFPSYVLRRGAAPQPVWNDSDDDRDGVPNADDLMPFDFDNDGANDSSEGGDMDGDGAVEWPHGPDYWLNTTIPAGFPPEYVGGARSLYVGPISEREMLGEDTVILWIDYDGDPSTGSPAPGGFGADFVALVIGRAGAVGETIIASYDPSQGEIPWLDLGTAFPVANDFGLLEGSLPSWALAAASAVSVELRDSEGSSDAGDDPLTLQAIPSTTRSIAGDNVVINELVVVPNNAEWVELCNPTAAPINIGGWRLRVGNNNIVTFPANTILGAFGSGTEYYVATFYGNGNDLPNGGDTLRLQWDSPGPGWTTLDQTTYTALVTGQSWARFKNATFGMPTDTDSDANDFYRSVVPTFRAPNDRRAPTIVVSKVGDVAIAMPGDPITYEIHYNNTGDGNARHVWINDTIPAGTTYVSSSDPFSTVSGQTYGWHFTQVAPGDHSLEVTVQVNAGVPTGTVLVNTVTLAYTDQLSRPRSPSSDWYNVTVQAPQPEITVAKVASTSTAFAGETVTFYIYYNNSGPGNAGDVWLNDTLPVGLTYVSGFPVPSVSGQSVSWHFTNVIPGSHLVEVQAVIGSAVAVGTTLTNTVTCDYEDSSGFALPQTTSSASVTVDNPLTSIVINEVSVRPSNGEWIELCNPSAVAVNIGGWRVRVGATTLYTFPAGTTIGAWGSGSEYLVVDLSSAANDLPNGGGTVRLQRRVGLLWQTVDQTTYAAFGIDGRSWARFKHEDTGKPVDTDVDANDFYVSNNAWIVPEGPTRGGANDRHRPVITVVKRASVTEAEPGNVVIYTIWYNNTGDGNAKRVWVNDTLPAGTTYLSATPAPVSISGQLVSWYFATVLKGTTNSISVSILISSEPADGTIISNAADLSYQDQLQRPMTPSRSWANVTLRRPAIRVEKVADVAVVQAGGTINYTIYYNNTGSRTAAHVWINDTLPNGVAYQSSSVAPSSVAGLTYGWHFTSVAPGGHSLTVTVTVNATTPSGTITNLARLNYTASNSKPLTGSSDTALVVVPEYGPEGFAVVLLILLGIAYRSRRRRVAI